MVRHKQLFASLGVFSTALRKQDMRPKYEALSIRPDSLEASSYEKPKGSSCLHERYIFTGVFFHDGAADTVSPIYGM